MSSAVFDIYKDVTQKIVMNLKDGIIPWRKKWCSPILVKCNWKTQRKYNGINLLILKDEGEYLTFKQCQEAGGHVKPGEKAHTIYQWIPYVKKEDKEEYERRIKEGEDTDDLVTPILKHLNVFHISQTEGIKSKEEKTGYTDAKSPVDMAELCLSALCQKVKEEKIDECYTDTDNILHVPARKQFESEEQWYNSVFSHVAQNQMQIKENTKPALVELTSEMAACMIMTGVGLNTEAAFTDTIYDCSYWAQQLNDDVKLVIKAAGNAYKIAEKVLEPIM